MVCLLQVLVYYVERLETPYAKSSSVIDLVEGYRVHSSFRLDDQNSIPRAPNNRTTSYVAKQTELSDWSVQGV